MVAGEGIGSFALGPLQSLVTLERIYLISARLAVPLFLLGWRLSGRIKTS